MVKACAQILLPFLRLNLSNILLPILCTFKQVIKLFTLYTIIFFFEQAVLRVLPSPYSCPCGGLSVPAMICVQLGAVSVVLMSVAVRSNELCAGFWTEMRVSGPSGTRCCACRHLRAVAPSPLPMARLFQR
jgi:hypothetical protein